MSTPRKRADVLDGGALAPRLTKWDLRLLRALPSAEHPYVESAVTPWQIGEQLHDEDVAGIRQALDGLTDRRLVWRSWWTVRSDGKPARYVRSKAGDDYLGGEGEATE